MYGLTHTYCHHKLVPKIAKTSVAVLDVKLRLLKGQNWGRRRYSAVITVRKVHFMVAATEMNIWTA